MGWRRKLEQDLIAASGYSTAIEMCNDGGPVPNKQVVVIAIQYLKSSVDPHEGDILLGILRRSPANFDAHPLCEYFDREPRNRWAVAEVMNASKGKVPCDWMERTIRDKKFGKDREMLCYAIVKSCPAERARQALRDVFEEFPGHACKGLGKVGTREDLDMMLEATTRLTGWQARAIESQGIRPLAKRLGVTIAKEPSRKRRK
ncbi:MAG: hypothetical protein QM783_05105 [Phycisphaerales bacterium]